MLQLLDDRFDFFMPSRGFKESGYSLRPKRRRPPRQAGAHKYGEWDTMRLSDL